MNRHARCKELVFSLDATRTIACCRKNYTRRKEFEKTESFRRAFAKIKIILKSFAAAANRSRPLASYERGGLYYVTIRNLGRAGSKTRKGTGGGDFSEIGGKHGGTGARHHYLVRDATRRSEIRNL